MNRIKSPISKAPGASVGAMLCGVRMPASRVRLPRKCSVAANGRIFRLRSDDFFLKHERSHRGALSTVSTGHRLVDPALRHANELHSAARCGKPQLLHGPRGAQTNNDSADALTLAQAVQRWPRPSRQRFASHAAPAWQHRAMGNFGALAPAISSSRGSRLDCLQQANALRPDIPLSAAEVARQSLSGRTPGAADGFRARRSRRPANAQKSLAAGHRLSRRLQARIKIVVFAPRRPS